MRAIESIAPKALIVFSLLLVLSGSAINARAQNAGEAVFIVPFEFTAGGTRLPAGEYVVRRTSESGAAYFVRSRDGRSVATVTVKNRPRSYTDGGPAQLTFNVYGGQYFLSQARPGIDRAMAEFHRSAPERQVAKGASDARQVKVIASRK